MKFYFFLHTKNIYNMESSLCLTSIDLRESNTVDVKIGKNKYIKLLDNIVNYIGPVTDIIEQYNSFIFIRMPNILRNSPLYIGDVNTIKHVKVVINIKDDTYFDKPITVNDTLMYPLYAIVNKLNYTCKIHADIELYKPNINYSNNELLRDEEGNVIYTLDENNVEKRYNIFDIPVMVRSKACNLYKLSDRQRMENGSCASDPGSYFVVNGNPYVVVGQEQGANNKPSIIVDMKSTADIKPIILRYISKTQVDSQLLILKLNDEKNDLGNKPSDIVVQITINYNTDIKKGINVYTIYKLFVPEWDVNDVTNHIMSFVPSKYKSKVKSILNHTKLEYLNNPENLSPYDKIRSIIKPTNIKPKKGKKSVSNDDYITEIDNIDEDKIEEFIYNKMMKIFLPENKTVIGKLNQFAYLISNYLEYLAKFRNIDNRDHWSNKKITSAAGNFEKILLPSFRLLCNKHIKDIKVNPETSVKSIISNLGLKDIHNKLSNHLISIFSSYIGWSVIGGKFTENIAQLLNIDNRVAMLSHLNRTIVTGSNMSKNMTARDVQISQLLYFDPNQTPESEQLGLVKHRTIVCRYSNYVDPYIIIDILNNNNLLQENRDKNNLDIVIVEGVVAGFSNGAFLYNYLRENIRRRIGLQYIGLVYDEVHRVLKVLTDMGRPAAPLLTINPETNNLYIDEKDLWNADLNTLIREGVLEYICPEEIEYKLVAIRENFLTEQNAELEKLQENINSLNIQIAQLDEPNILLENTLKTYQNKLNSFKKYTHMLIHGLSSMGIASSLIPLSNNNQGPRIAYGCNHLGQAIGPVNGLGTNIANISQTRVLNSTEKALVNTSMYEVYGINDIPGGQNVIIAMMTYGGYNMEDGIIVSKQALDLGAFMTTIYKTIIIETGQTNINGDIAMEKIAYPIHSKPITDTSNPYANLDKNGIVKLHAKVKDGDCLVGMIRYHSAGNAKKESDASYYSKLDEHGIVDQVIHNYNKQTGQGMVIIRLRVTKSAEVGDKMADRHAQKGTITKILPSTDMPYFEDGSMPTLILSPWAIPSRMTMGKLWETIMAMYGILTGQYMDATAFEEYDYNKMLNYMEFYGFNRYGLRKMYDPHTGNELEAMVFSGPNYYQVLKHFVTLKKQVAEGTIVDSITRQPISGRGKKSGLRVGEMEMHVAFAHGAAGVVNSILGQSDSITIARCLQCGGQAHKGDRNNLYSCSVCKNTEDFSRVKTTSLAELINNTVAGFGVLTNYKLTKKE